MAHTGSITPFHRGDEVVLAEGTYQGTMGVFVGLRDDAGWADITESNGAVRSHPVAWLRRCLESGGRSLSSATESVGPETQ
jgi:hypothetical protein